MPKLTAAERVAYVRYRTAVGVARNEYGEALREEVVLRLDELVELGAAYAAAIDVAWDEYERAVEALRPALV